jgi:ankyrin repeat protein
VENGADINAKEDDGMSALLKASCEGHVDIVKMLLEKGADVNAKDRFGRTSLSLSFHTPNTGTTAVIKKYIRIKLMEEILKIALIVKKGITREEDKLLVPYAQRETIRHIASFF